MGALTKSAEPAACSLGYLDSARLSNIPSKFRAHHEFCFFLHDQLVGCLREYDSRGPHKIVANALCAGLKSAVKTESNNIFDCLRNGQSDTAYRHAVVSHLVLGLAADMLNFLYEGLTCLESRKFVVALTLLRKPLKENLLHLAYIAGNDREYVTNFEADTCNNFKGLPSDPVKRREVIANALAVLPAGHPFDVDSLESVIYAKDAEDGFEPYWQRAMHLITSQGAHLRTEDFNLNWLYHNPAADDLFEVVYPKLAYVMLYLFHVTLACFAKLGEFHEAMACWLRLASHSLAEELMPRLWGGTPHTDALARALAPLLRCADCQATLAVTNLNATQLYIKETVTCAACGGPVPVSVYALLEASTEGKTASPLFGSSLFSQLVAEATAEPPIDHRVEAAALPLGLLAHSATPTEAQAEFFLKPGT